MQSLNLKSLIGSGQQWKVAVLGTLVLPILSITFMWVTWWTHMPSSCHLIDGESRKPAQKHPLDSMH